MDADTLHIFGIQKKKVVLLLVNSHSSSKWIASQGVERSAHFLWQPRGSAVEFAFGRERGRGLHGGWPISRVCFTRLVCSKCCEQHYFSAFMHCTLHVVR